MGVVLCEPVLGISNGHSSRADSMNVHHVINIGTIISVIIPPRGIETIPALLALCEKNPPVIGFSHHKGLVTRALMVSLMLASTNLWINRRDIGDLRHQDSQCDVSVMHSVLNNHDPVRVNHVLHEQESRRK